MSPRTLIVSAAVAVGLTAGPGVSPAAAKDCGNSRSLGATYVNNIDAKGVSCGKARDVIRAFNSCRRNNGGADGRCNKRVSGGFRCNEGSRNRGAFQYFAKVSCKKGGKRVRFDYSQNT
jgi:hypothetical protein